MGVGVRGGGGGEGGGGSEPTSPWLRLMMQEATLPLPLPAPAPVPLPVPLTFLRLTMQPVWKPLKARSTSSSRSNCLGTLESARQPKSCSTPRCSSISR